VPVTFHEYYLKLLCQFETEKAVGQSVTAQLLFRFRISQKPVLKKFPLLFFFSFSRSRNAVSTGGVHHDAFLAQNTAMMILVLTAHARLFIVNCLFTLVQVWPFLLSYINHLQSRLFLSCSCDVNWLSIMSALCIGCAKSWPLTVFLRFGSITTGNFEAKFFTVVS